MKVIAVYVMTKEKMCREIADKTVDLYMSGMSYEEALEKAKEILENTNKNYKWIKLGNII